MAASRDPVIDPTVMRTILRGKNSTPKRPKTARAQRTLETRARWATKQITRHPTATYNELIDEVREHFECGINSAEMVISRANEMFAEAAMSISPDKLIAMYWEALDLARSDPRPSRAAAASARILDSIFEKTGLAAPQRLEHSFIDLQRQTHVGALSMTPTQRASREQELHELARTRMIDAASVEVKDASDKALSAPPTPEILDEEFERAMRVGEDDEDIE